MDTSFITSLISGVVAILAVTLGYLLGKRRDSDDSKRKLKIDHYEEFVKALSATILGRAGGRSEVSLEAKKRFCDACNSLLIVASPKVVIELYKMLDGTKVENRHANMENHDRLMTDFLKAMGEDIEVSNEGFDESFRFGLQTPTV